MAALLARQMALTALTVFAAHALTVLLVQVLPTSAEQLLGLFGIQEEVLSALSEVNQPRSYRDMVLGYLHFEFGTTSDGVPVEVEIVRAFNDSMPRLGAAILIALVAAFVTTLFISMEERRALFLISYLLFFPPYGVPFVLLACLLFTGFGLSGESPVAWMTGILAIAVTPAAMLSVQAGAVMKKEMRAPHAAMLLVNGVPPRDLRMLLMTNVTVALIPTLEKVIASALTGLLFSELVLGLSGLGTLAVRAVRRSDIELIAAVVVVFCVVISATRAASATARHAYGLRT